MTYVPNSKIDDLAVNGLLGVPDSLAYEVQEIENHFHSYERWLEAAPSPTSLDAATRAGQGTGTYQLDAGNNTWGDWVPLIGANDTPLISGSAYFDMHRIEVTAAERDNAYIVQFGFGVTGSAILEAESYTETMFTPASNLIDSGPLELHVPRMPTGTIVWARAYCPGQNTATINFYLGVHEYPG